MPPLHDLTGQRFGKLVVTAREHRATRDAYWLCQCDCGNKTIVSRGNLLNGSTNSCKCIRNIQGGWTRKHPLWKRWSVIIDRCYNHNSKDYKNYGARGIQVCERWLLFPNFLADMESTYREGLTVERKDVNGNYEPDNCIWATRTQQARNKRFNRIIETPWGRITIGEASERAGLSGTTLYNRLKLGWPIEKALRNGKYHRFRNTI